MLTGNMNAATAYAAVKELKLLEKALSGRLAKADKEATLRRVRDLRRDLKMPELPDYNSEKFSEALRKRIDVV